MSQVLSALLHGVCTVYTNDQQTSKAFVQGEFPIKWKWVSESTADFLAAMDHNRFGMGLSLSVLSSITKVSPVGSGWSSRGNLISLKEKGNYWTISIQCMEEYTIVAYCLAMQLTDALTQIGTSCQMGTCQMPGS